MYSIDQSTQESAGGGIAGIQENFELVEVSYGGAGKDGGGAKALRFIFKRGENFTFTHNVFPIDEEKVASWSKTDSTGVELPKVEKIKAAYKDQASQIKHILTKFIPEDKVALKGANFEEFSKAVIELLKNKTKGEKLRLKLVYNKKNYLSFPKFNFIENMTVAKKDSKLKINPKYDKITKDAPDTEEDATSDAATSPSRVPEENDF
jgi:hypothetical protein